MKTEKTNKKTGLRVLKKQFFLITILLIITALLSVGYSGYSDHHESDALWEPLSRANRSSRDAAAAAAIERRVEDILEVFRKALPFNPPKGFAVMPRLQYLNPIALPGNTHTPEPVHLRFALRMPPQSNDIVAGINLWINDPYNLLGEPLLSDSEGELFLLPPDVGTKAGERIISRMAHPPGYDNEYPCSSIFPLWSDDQEPFLRSVVRLSFGLAKATVTTVYTANNRPFYKPVSKERWINAMIAAAEKEIGDITSGISAAEELNFTEQQTTQLKRNLDRMRQAYSEENIIQNYRGAIAQLKPGIEMLRQTDPAQAEELYTTTIVGMEKAMEEALIQAVEMRKQIDEMEEQLLSAIAQREGIWQQMEAAIEQGDWDAIDKMGSEHNLSNLKLVADAGRSIGRLRAELTAMSPIQRRAPAFGFLIPDDHPLGTQRQVMAMVFEAERASGLVPANVKGARAIVSINPEFFNFPDNGAPIKLMAVEYWGRNTITYDNNRRNLLDDIWQYLDWQELKAMVR